MIDHKQADARTRAMILGLLAGGAAAALLPASSQAQTADQTRAADHAPASASASEIDPMDEDYELEELVVTSARKQPGAVIGDIPPELQLSPRDIRAYGVSSVAELVDALAPQTGTASGGRPVMLVNGARISGFSEVRDLPTEAILRVDILPEEVSLKYGYRADQKVMNLVLRPRFRAFTAEAGYRAPTQDGGGDTADAHGNLLHIRRQNRLQLDIKASRTSPLLESERDLVGRTDSAFRTLQPESRSLALNAVLTRPLAQGVSATVNASLDAGDSEGQLGLSPFASSALQRRTDTLDGHLGVVVNGALSGWMWSYTGNADSSESETTTQRALAAGAFTDRSRSQSTSAGSELVLNRPLFHLPAGAVSTTLTGGASTLNFESQSTRSGVRRSADLTRDSGELKASLDVPLTKREGNVLGAIGTLSANLNLAVEDLSDFGALTTVGYGVNWSPVKPLRVIASFSQEDGAPSVQQIGNPEVVTPGVRVFDLRRGETADVTRVEGGSPGLDASTRQVFKLGLNLKPFEKTDVTFTANYTSSSTRDAIAAFPSASTQVENAFPERFVRDADGRLVQIDTRPVNFERQDRDELRWGFNFRKTLPSNRPVGAARFQGQEQPRRQEPGQTPSAAAAPGGSASPAAAPAGAPADRAPGAERAPGGARAGGGFRGGGGGGGGTFQVGLYHTVVFRDEILIRQGVPVLDLLNGGATGNGGGSPRHQIDLQSNLSRNGLGVSFNAKWQSGTTVRATGGRVTDDLNFSDLTTVNLRLFADLGAQPIARRHRWLRGARATLAVNNLFDSRQDVRTAGGTTPISYQPDYLDPVGRSVRLSVRKLFF